MGCPPPRRPAPPPQRQRKTQWQRDYEEALRELDRDFPQIDVAQPVSTMPWLFPDVNGPAPTGNPGTR